MPKFVRAFFSVAALAGAGLGFSQVVAFAQTATAGQIIISEFRV